MIVSSIKMWKGQVQSICKIHMKNIDVISSNYSKHIIITEFCTGVLVGPLM